MNKIVTDYTGLGETGEIYIVDRDGYMLTPSRFGDDAALKRKVNTVNINNCFSMVSMGLTERGIVHQKEHIDISPKAPAFPSLFSAPIDVEISSIKFFFFVFISSWPRPNLFIE